MPKLKERCPKKCRDRNQAFSWYNGKRYYHGKWGTPETEENFRRFRIALLENPTLLLQDSKTGDMFVSELAADFLRYVETKSDYTELSHFKRVVGFLVDIYGGLSVNEFSPKKLKVVRMRMSRSNEIRRQYGTKLENLWIGHSKKVADKHYFVATPEDYAVAVGKKPATESLDRAFERVFAGHC